MKSKRARDTVVAADGEKQPDVQLAEEPSSKKQKRDSDDVEASADKGKKDKKDKKDKKKKKHSGETRKEKKDKRKDLQDLPEQDDSEEEEAAAPEVVKEEKESKKSKKNKDKKSKETTTEAEEAVNGDSEKKDSKKKKKNKDKKDKKDKNQDKDAAAAAASSKETNGDGIANGIDLDESTTKKNDRHIVFVGNLPYTATVATISAHFASLSPIAVRCLTNKGERDPKVTCKGIAFVEFANVWTQRTCLDKFHHSMFDDGKSAARKINVELTAGGGGKNQNRTEKIFEKNKKLDENRQKRIEKEKTAKVASKTDSSSEQHLQDSIHPSRRGRVPGGGWN